MDASQPLKPALASGRLRCIGSTTFQEFRQHFEQDRALARRFQRVEVNEPTVEDTIKILQGLQAPVRGVPRRHLHRRGPRAPRPSSRAVPPRPEAARQGHRSARRSRRRRQARRARSRRGRACRRPRADRDRPREDGADPAARGLDQRQGPPEEPGDGPQGARSSVRKRRSPSSPAPSSLARAGLRSPEKPIGSFLFTGPTGVGKTEVAKQLAKVLGIAFSAST